jgi:hypothetical protein
MSLAGTDDLLNRAKRPPIVIVKCLKRRPRLPRSVQRDGKRYQRRAMLAMTQAISSAE